MNKRRRFKAKAQRAFNAFHQHLAAADVRFMCGPGHGGSFCLKRMLRTDLKAPTRCVYHGGCR